MNKRQWYASVIVASIGAVITIVSAAQYFEIPSLLRTQVVSQPLCGFFGGNEVCIKGGGLLDDSEPVEVSICNDRKDNDKDGFVDKNDLGCYNLAGLVGQLDTNEITSADAFRDLVLGEAGATRYLPSRDTEIGEPGCADGADNDDDELIDEDDAGCKDPQTGKYNPFENEPGDEAECNDGQDNDSDGLIDVKDPGCHVGGYLRTQYDPDENENGGTACADGADNDGDGRVDKADPGCHRGGVLRFPWLTIPSPYNPNDTNEGGEAACANNKDDDGNGFVDDKDPGCYFIAFNWNKTTIIRAIYLPRRNQE